MGKVGKIVKKVAKKAGKAAVKAAVITVAAETGIQIKPKL